MTSPDLNAIAEPFSRPIPGPNPGGENARHDPRHEAVRTQMDKLSRPDGGPVDWEEVHELSRALLTETSKDYLIASYFAIAGYVRSGPRGLVEGMAALNALLEHHWETGFPPPARLRARINAIDWFVERVESVAGLASTSVAPGDPQLLSQATSALEAQVLARFEDDMPNIHRLKDTLGRLQADIAARAPEAPAPTPEPHASAPPEDPPPASVSPAESVGDESGTPAPPAPEPEDTGADPAPPAEGSAEARLEQLCAPFAAAIEGAHPAGESARFDPRHEAIRREVEKLGRPSADPVHWDEVERDGRALLTEASKDFQIASYFAFASYVRGGVRGLVAGLAAPVALLRDYWDSGFPPTKRIRARIRAIDWLIDRIGSYEPEDLTVEPADLTLLGLVAKQFESLVLDRFEDDMPNIYGLKETLQALESQLAAIAPDSPAREPSDTVPEAVASQTPTTSEAATSTSPVPDARTQTPTAKMPAPPAPAVRAVELDKPTAELADPAQVDKFLSEVGTSLHKAGRALFKVSVEDPLAYRLCRQGLYLQFKQAPPATSGNMTMAPPPPAGREATLEALSSSQNWATLLDEAESGLPTARLWLDQHRYVALALAQLGHQRARDVVVGETAALTRRLPELLEREFSDGRPFANQATRQWLADVAGGPTATTVPAGPPSSNDSHDEARQEARRLATTGELEAALQTLDALIAEKALVGRDRFVTRLAMADACVVAGSPALAEGILAGLDVDISRFGLEEWEPELAEACYRAHYEALAAMPSPTGQWTEERIAVYRRLCRLAPSAAFKLGKPPPVSGR